MTGHKPPPTDDQVQAARDLEDSYIKTRDQITQVFSAQAAAKEGLKQYQREVDARQKALTLVQAKAEQVAQKPESPLIEVSSAKAEVRKRQVDLWDAQRQQSVFKIAADAADEEFKHLQELANYKAPAKASASDKAKETFSKQFGTFIKANRGARSRPGRRASGRQAHRDGPTL